MMADFMGDDICLREVAWSLEASLKFIVEGKIDINVAILRAVEWPAGSRRESARRIYAPSEQD